jgi:hypothetical protein
MMATQAPIPPDNLPARLEQIERLYRTRACSAGSLFLAAAYAQVALEVQELRLDIEEGQP